MTDEKRPPRPRVAGESECERLLLSKNPPEKVLAHCEAAADMAFALATALNAAGLELDTALCVRAALLHDVLRTEKRHAEAGAALLQEQGLELEAEIVAAHMGFGVDFDAMTEREVVFLADKLVKRDRRVSVSERFDLRLREVEDIPEARDRVLRLRDGALRLEARVEALLGKPLSEL